MEILEVAKFKTERAAKRLAELRAQMAQAQAEHDRLLDFQKTYAILAAEGAESNRPLQAGVKEQIITAVQAILANGPKQTRDIFSELPSLNVHIGGADPINNLSAYLSRAKNHFSFDRAVGWSLVSSQLGNMQVDIETSIEADTKAS